MVKLLVKNGVDLPIKGAAQEELLSLSIPKEISCNLEPFDHIRFKLLAKEGERVKIGSPIVENKAIEGLFFVSPASGVIKEIRRGLKRRLTDLVIELDEREEYEEQGTCNYKNCSRNDLVEFLKKTGAFAHIGMRPFDLGAHPYQKPRNIFVKAVETLPFVPSAHWQVKGWEEMFQKGLDLLSFLTEGAVHLVYKENDFTPAFKNAENVEHHTVQGPHPAGNLSYAIEQIAPIRHVHDIIWTLSAVDVVTIGRLAIEGRYHTERVISLAGEGVKSNCRKLYKARMGYPISQLCSDRLENFPSRILSGDPLMGMAVTGEDFLHFGHTSVSVLKRKVGREPFHFFRLGKEKFTATRTYLSGLKKPPPEGYSFTTNQHGELRAFIDGKVYKKTMPLNIPTMELIKAILAEDFEFAEKLGLLEVVPEDFALPSFICPSKIEMIDIVKKGLRHYAQEVGYS